MRTLPPISLVVRRCPVASCPPMKYWEVIADKLSAAGVPFALLVFVVASAFAKSTAPEVIFISPCECQGFHGKHRWDSQNRSQARPVRYLCDSIGDTLTDRIARRSCDLGRNRKGRILNCVELRRVLGIGPVSGRPEAAELPAPLGFLIMGNYRNCD